MKKLLLVVAAVAALLAVPCGPALERSFHSAAAIAPINAIVGDAGYLAATGRAPDARVSDDVRIRAHLSWVLARLRAAPVGHLSDAGREARARNLERLAAYIAAGEFPRNPATVRARTPNFLDDAGRICAVGALVRADLGQAAVEAIRERFQFARIPDIRSGALASWQLASGLSLRELAMIQPEYCPGGEPGCAGNIGPEDRTGDLTRGETAVGAVNLALASANGVLIARGQPSLALGLAGIGTGVAGGVMAAASDSRRPWLGAAAGFASGVVGLVAVQRQHRLAEARRSSPVALTLAPGPGGRSFVALELKF